ncbi:MAG: hypothetical protein CM1200mP24_06450 [Gammaproteobacteria bacterium]|nr:MAG: hypothetical protein CM1200mP24_06450 [Gammaproteobacteria bacterium]
MMHRICNRDRWLRHGFRNRYAIETSPVTIMRSDLRLVSSAIEISRLTFRKIKQNLFWAFVYNVIMLPFWERLVI